MSTPSNRPAAPLYNRHILALAAEALKYPPLEKARLSGALRSRTCGSQAALTMNVDKRGGIAQLGLDVKACALGQAAAALLARHAIGLDYAAMRAARDQLLAWLGGQDDAPAWPEFEALVAVKDFPARHNAILLPFDAAVMLLDGI